MISISSLVWGGFASGRKAGGLGSNSSTGGVIGSKEDAGTLLVNAGGSWSCTWSVAGLVDSLKSKEHDAKSVGGANLGGGAVGLGTNGLGTSIFVGGTVVVTRVAAAGVAALTSSTMCEASGSCCYFKRSNSVATTSWMAMLIAVLRAMAQSCKNSLSCLVSMGNFCHVFSSMCWSGVQGLLFLTW